MTVEAVEQPATVSLAEKRRLNLAKARAARGKKTIPVARAGAMDQNPESAVAKHSNTIIYEPADGDPTSVIVSGLKFKANIPVEVERKTTVLQTLVEKRELKDGTIVTQGVDKKVPLADVLKGNPRFRIDGVKPNIVPGVQRVPDDPQSYRGYCQHWMRLANTAKELSDRWQAEAVLRERCGLTEQDLAYLMPFYEARSDMLSAAA